MKTNLWKIALTLVVLSTLTLACGFSLGGDDKEEPAAAEQTGDDGAAEAEPEKAEEAEEAEEPAPAADDSAKPESEFPMPDAKIENFTQLGEGQYNYQVAMSMEEVIEFYTTALEAQGLTEREILHVVSDTTFNMVFDGASNGKAVVIQGVLMGDMVNVNIRYEDV